MPLARERGGEREHRRQLVGAYRPVEALLPAHWRQGHVVANGLRQHYYRTGGDRPPLVLLHGILDSALTWLRTARALEADYDVIMLDTRGHGSSDRIGEHYTAALLAQDATAAIAALNDRPVRLLGHSQGGVTGIHVAADRPELVRGLIVEGAGEEQSNPSTEVARSPGYQAWLSAYTAWLEQLKRQTHAERLGSGLDQLPAAVPVPVEEDYVAWVEGCAHVDLALVGRSAALWAALGETTRDMLSALERVRCPVLIMRSGAFPQPGATVTVEPLSSTRANVQEVRFNNAGHVLHQEQFELFIGEVRRFLQPLDRMGQ